MKRLSNHGRSCDRRDEWVGLSRPKDYERAVVVDAEVKEEQGRPRFRSERRRALKKDLAGPTLSAMSG